MNRQPFNRSAFNRPLSTSTTSTGLSQIKLKGSAVANRTISVPESRAHLLAKGSLAPVLVKFNSANVALKLEALGNGVKALSVEAGSAEIVLAASAQQAVQGEAVIALEGLTLAPGDELIINTIDMTVTVNGQNGMKYFSPYSEFFALLNGANTLIYSDTVAARKINFDVIWKDRWL